MIVFVSPNKKIVDTPNSEFCNFFYSASTFVSPKNEIMYNMTCLVTGKSDNLRMHAMRNNDQSIIGWVFLHESIEFDSVDTTINWKFTAKVNSGSIPVVGQKSRIDNV